MDISAFEAKLAEESVIFHLAQPGEKGFIALDNDVLYIIQKQTNDEAFQFTEFFMENVQKITIEKPDGNARSRYEQNPDAEKATELPKNLSKLILDFPNYQDNFVIQSSPQEATLQILQKRPHVDL